MYTFLFPVCSLNGNPNIDPATPINNKKRNNLGLIIGLAVGLPVGLLLIAVGVYLFVRGRQRPNPGEAATGTPQVGTKPLPDQSSSNISMTAQPTVPPLVAGPFNEEDLHEVHKLQNMMGSRR